MLLKLSIPGTDDYTFPDHSSLWQLFPASPLQLALKSLISVLSSRHFLQTWALLHGRPELIAWHRRPGDHVAPQNHGSKENAATMRGAGTQLRISTFAGFRRSAITAHKHMQTRIATRLDAS